MVGRPERQHRANRPRQLERLEDHVQATADIADDHVGRDRGSGEADPADVRAADAVCPDLRQAAVGARFEPALVDEEQAESERPTPRAGPREDAGQLGPRGVVDQPLLAVEPPRLLVGRGRELAREQVAAVIALGEPPGDQPPGPDLLGEPPALALASRHPHRDRPQKRLGVRDRDGQVAAGHGPDHER